MRRVYDDQLLDVFRKSAREGPGQEASPVVPGEKAFVVAEVTNQAADVFQQKVDLILLDARRLRRKVIAAQVRRDSVEIAAKLLDLLLPLVPEFGESVE